MSKTYSKEETIVLKKQCFKSLNSLLESFIAKPLPSKETDIDYMKKAALISKWLKQYVNYISFEERFSPKKLISYKRGDIVFANFGFNIGAEFGGEHYAVVIDKENDRNSPTVTVIPLSSYKPEKEIHPNDLYLGNELYQKMNLKLKTIIPKLQEQVAKDELMLSLINEKLSSNYTEDTNYEIDSLISELKNSINQHKLESSAAKKLQNEIVTLKQGSIAKIQQITTISKMRIYNPKSSYDPLHGIRFSEETMKLINAKIKDFFIFDE